MTTGWKLDRDQREALLCRFPPLYPNVIADHVTLLANHLGGMTAEPPGDAEMPVIVGYSHDGEGVEAMVVSIGGTTQRPHGSRWHITWSLMPERTAKESNAVIAAHGWTAMTPIHLKLTPVRW